MLFQHHISAVFTLFFVSAPALLPCLHSLRTLHCSLPPWSLCSRSPPLWKAEIMFWFHIATKPHRQTLLVQFVTSTWLSLVSLSVGGGPFDCPQKKKKNRPNNHSFVVWYIYLANIYWVPATCCTGVRKMSNTAAIAPGSPHSGKGRLTNQQAATKPAGKCFAGDRGGPETFPCLQHHRILQRRLHGSRS